MGRTQLALTSSVAAIPAAVLVYLLAMAFLNHADTLNTMMKLIAGMALASAFAITLMPVGLLVYGGRKPKEDAEADAGKSSDDVVSADVEEASGEVEASDLVEDEDAASDAEVEEATEDSDSSLMESDEFIMEESDADIMSDSSGEFVSTTDSSLDEVESIEFEDEDEEPKSKKRKK